MSNLIPMQDISEAETLWKSIMTAAPSPHGGLMWDSISQIQIGPETYVSDANTARTADYLQKDQGSRRSKPAIPGCVSQTPSELRALREKAMENTMRCYPSQIYRTVVVPLTENIRQTLDNARRRIL